MSETYKLSKLNISNDDKRQLAVMAAMCLDDRFERKAAAPSRTALDRKAELSELIKVAMRAHGDSDGGAKLSFQFISGDVVYEAKMSLVTPKAQEPSTRHSLYTLSGSHDAGEARDLTLSWIKEADTVEAVKVPSQTDLALMLEEYLTFGKDAVEEPKEVAQDDGSREALFGAKEYLKNFLKENFGEEECALIMEADENAGIPVTMTLFNLVTQVSGERKPYWRLNPLKPLKEGRKAG